MDSAVAETKACKACWISFDILEKDKEYYNQLSPLFAWKRYTIPSPSYCPDCRHKKRTCFRNERNLYKRPCSSSGKEIITIYSPDKDQKVFDQDIRWGDSRDGLNFGMSFDFSKTFTEQFRTLQKSVPRIALFNVNPENSHYCQQAYDNKNSYLCFVVKDCEECMYVSHSNRLTRCYDCAHLQDSEYCYECLDSDKLYGCAYCEWCQWSSNLLYCTDCMGCDKCMGCIWLRNKNFCIFNKQYTQEEYQQREQKMSLWIYPNAQAFKERLKQFLPTQIHRFLQNINSHNCLGNYIINSKNLYKVFDAFELEDCAYSTWIFESKDCHDIYGMGTSNLVYNSLGVEKLNTAAFCTFVSHTRNAYYSDLCFDCNDIFGCIGLKNKSYCIFNKQYTPEEYELTVAKIIDRMIETGEWWEFFHSSLSPFGYNETVANEHFPLEKSQATAWWFNRSDYITPMPQADKTLKVTELQPHIALVEEDIIKSAVECEVTNKPFRIMKQELDFLKKWSIPLPRRHPDQRHKDRMGRRNPRKLFDRKCSQCAADMKTTYSPDRPEVVYCEVCYNKAIYG